MSDGRVPDQAALYDHIRKAPVRKSAVDGKTAGNVEEAFKTAAKTPVPVVAQRTYANEDAIDLFRRALVLLDNVLDITVWPLQQQLADRNLADPDPPGVFTFLFGTHPPAIDRIGAALAWEQGLKGQEIAAAPRRYFVASTRPVCG